MGKLKHANPETYTNDLKDALDEFEEALLWRYEADLDDVTKIWTTHGYKPELYDVNEGRGQYKAAKTSAPEWAGEVRDLVSKSIVDRGTQDLNKLKDAFEDLESAAELLGEDRGTDDYGILGLTIDINDKCDWAGWAGASGEAFKENFGESVSWTLANQLSIAASLANLYSGRACIIEAFRRNIINKIRLAAKALRETEDTGEENLRWLGIGLAVIGVGLAATPGVGAAISIVAAFAGFLDAEDPDQKFSNDIEEIVDTLKIQLAQAGSSASSEEDCALYDTIIELQIEIKNTPSKKLELYDFTGGDYSPGVPADGFDVSVDDVYKLSELCSQASRVYEKVVAKVISTDDADGELRGQDNVETAADVELIDTKNALVSFLKTTCARYYEASDRLHDTAREYSGVETDNEEKLKGAEDGPDFNGDGDGKGGSVDKHVKESDRDDIEDVPQSAPGGGWGV